MANEPITREEILLNAIATGEQTNIKPITREEMFLAKLGGADVAVPTPITRKEQFLQKAIENGGNTGGGGGNTGGDSDDDSSQAPEMNEYGFYYNVPYVYANEAVMFTENGEFAMFHKENGGTPELTCIGMSPYVYNEETGTIVLMPMETNITFSNDGNTIYIPFTDATYTADTTIVSHGIYRNDTYISQDGDEIVCYEDGSITLWHNGFSDTIVENQWMGEYYCYISGRYSLRATIDGKTLYVMGYYEDNQLIAYKHSDDGSGDS